MVTSIVRRLRQKRTTSSPDAAEAVIVTNIIYIIVFVAVSILIKNYSIKWGAGQRIGIGIISGSSRNETKKTANIFCESIQQQQQQQQQQQERQPQWLEENFCIIDKTTTTSSSSPNLMLLLHRRLWKLLDRGIAPLINNTITEMKGWKTKLQDVITKERRNTVLKIRAAAYKEKLLKTQRAKLNTSANHLKTISDLYLTSLMREEKLTDLCKRLTKLVPAKCDDKKCRKSEELESSRRRRKRHSKLLLLDDFKGNATMILLKDNLQAARQELEYYRNFSSFLMEKLNKANAKVGSLENLCNEAVKELENAKRSMVERQFKDSSAAKMMQCEWRSTELRIRNLIYDKERMQRLIALRGQQLREYQHLILEKEAKVEETLLKLRFLVYKFMFRAKRSFEGEDDRPENALRATLLTGKVMNTDQNKESLYDTAATATAAASRGPSMSYELFRQIVKYKGDLHPRDKEQINKKLKIHTTLEIQEIVSQGVKEFIPELAGVL